MCFARTRMYNIIRPRQSKRTDNKNAQMNKRVTEKERGEMRNKRNEFMSLLSVTKIIVDFVETIGNTLNV